MEEIIQATVIYVITIVIFLNGLCIYYIFNHLTKPSWFKNAFLYSIIFIDIITFLYSLFIFLR